MQLAREQGWEPEVEPGHEIGWGDVISGYRDELQVVNPKRKHELVFTSFGFYNNFGRSGGRKIHFARRVANNQQN